MKVVGRKSEIEIMKNCLKDNKSHLLAMIGRRRVGKTFLIREIYKENMIFEMIGLKDAGHEKQLLNFTFQMNILFQRDEEFKMKNSWLLAFHQLTKVLQKQKFVNKPVIFFDEVPWIASKRSGFTEALAHWWNSWASQQEIVVVICGSAAAWMIKHIVNAKGGLHNRITRLITLMPFTLAETKMFFERKHITMSNYQIVQIYMAVGGIPHYLEHVVKGKSAAQNIQEMCFSKDGLLRTEFDNLYPALFENSSNHIRIIKAIANKTKGLDRQEILKKTKMSDGGWFTNILAELETSGFISTFQPLEKKIKGTLYRVTDEFTCFYLSFMEGKKQIKKDEWMITSETQKYKIWCGYAFENLCMKHVDEINVALGISGIQSNINSFLHHKNKTYEKGFQIDMLIDRKDSVITICEMKFHAEEYSISADYAKKVRTKKEGLRTVTKTKKMIHTIFITTFGVFENKHKIDLVDNDLTLDIFFNN